MRIINRIKLILIINLKIANKSFNSKISLFDKHLFIDHQMQSVTTGRVNVVL